MATQLSGLDGHHFSLRSILKNPSTVLPAESAGLQHISWATAEAEACGAELVPRIVDVAREPALRTGLHEV